MTRIQRIFADKDKKICENPLNPRHPRSINPHFLCQRYPNTTKSDVVSKISNLKSQISNLKIEFISTIRPSSLSYTLHPLTHMFLSWRSHEQSLD
jgi:hypothetical protein